MIKDTPALDALLDEINRLRQAESLLEQIWLESGPYANRSIEQDTWGRVQDHFDFDDSE